MSSDISSSQKYRLYNHLRGRGFPRLTVKILLGFEPDGLDRLTVMLGKGSPYDYRLLEEPGFREAELERYLSELT